MQYYPLFLDIKGKEILIIGGGYIALEKIQNLLKAGPKITVIAPLIRPGVARFNRRITFINREVYLSDITEKYLLVFCATGDSELNAKVSQYCLERRILCNTVDDPKWCHFIVPSMFRRGYLTIAISTAGVSPSLAKKIKASLREWIGPEYTQYTRWLFGFRETIKANIPTLSERMKFWTFFYKQEPLKLLKSSSIKTLENRARDWIKNYDA
jgi:siroheme synthase-like protein